MTEEAGFRVGFGYDAHRLAEGRALVLGGVTIPHPRGLEGHSDADVLTHAVIDALLGALGGGDIGRLFPPGDPAYKDIASFELLGQVMIRVRRAGYRIHNLDATLVAEEPRLAEHIPAMVEGLAGVLGVEPQGVNVKATTTEGMGFCGRGEGMAAYAVVSLAPAGAAGATRSKH